MKVLIGVAIAAGVLVCLPWLLARAARRWGVDAALRIPPCPEPKQEFAGHDDTLRVQSEERRRRAALVSRTAARIRTTDHGATADVRPFSRRA